MNLLFKSIPCPIETVSEANKHEHWTVSAKRHKQQKTLSKVYFNKLSAFKDKMIVVKLIRVSPRKLDKDENLPMAFKWVKDAIADLIYPGQQAGRADDTDLIKWEYAQEKGLPKAKPMMRIEVYG
jgi:hypothetical protein